MRHLLEAGSPVAHLHSDTCGVTEKELLLKRKWNVAQGKRVERLAAKMHFQVNWVELLFLQDSYALEKCTMLTICLE